VEIEDLLRRFETPRPSPALRARALAGSRPWRPWWLAAAAAVLVVLAVVNAMVDARVAALGRAPSVERSQPQALAMGEGAVRLDEIRRRTEDLMRKIDAIEGKRP
jgi:hypothetical protein